jgi:hypothetical protein
LYKKNLLEIRAAQREEFARPQDISHAREKAW